MAVTRWDPLRELEEMSGRLEQIMSRQGASRLEDRAMEGMPLADWIPTVDVSETDRGYSIHAELPGVERKDVKVTVENGVLSIEGERRHEQVERGRTHHRVERAYGRFVRSFPLAADANERRARAEYKNGLLHLHVPKTKTALPRRIEVTSPGGSVLIADGSSRRRLFGGSGGWGRVVGPLRRTWTRLSDRLKTIRRR